MKKIAAIMMASLFLSSSVALADIIPPDQKVIPGCAIIQNVESFQGTTFLAVFWTEGNNSEKPDAIMVLKNDTCIHTDKFESATLYAVSTVEYQENSKNPNYNPENDLNAYPEIMEVGATTLDTYDSYVDIASNETYSHRIYKINGIDNSKRVVSIAHISDKTNLAETIDKTTQPIPANLDIAIKINTPIFKDVTVSSPYAAAILELKRDGIISGYDDGTFRPDTLINRAEFTKIAIGKFLVQDLYNCPTGQLFKDVSMIDPTQNWFSGVVCIAKMKNVIGGYADGTFKPEQNINFAEAAKIIINNQDANVFGKTDQTGSNPWYKQYTDLFEKIKSVPSTVLSYGQFITRGEMTLMIYNVHKNALDLQ